MCTNALKIITGLLGRSLEALYRHGRHQFIASLKHVSLAVSALLLSMLLWRSLRASPLAVAMPKRRFAWRKAKASSQGCGRCGRTSCKPPWVVFSNLTGLSRALATTTFSRYANVKWTVQTLNHGACWQNLMNLLQMRLLCPLAHAPFSMPNGPYYELRCQSSPEHPFESSDWACDILIWSTDVCLPLSKSARHSEQWRLNPAWNWIPKNMDALRTTQQWATDCHRDLRSPGAPLDLFNSA